MIKELVLLRFWIVCGLHPDLDWSWTLPLTTCGQTASPSLILHPPQHTFRVFVKPSSIPHHPFNPPSTFFFCAKNRRQLHGLQHTSKLQELAALNPTSFHFILPPSPTHGVLLYSSHSLPAHHILVIGAYQLPSSESSPASYRLTRSSPTSHSLFCFINTDQIPP